MAARVADRVHVVAQANAPLNDDGTFRADKVLVRRSPQARSLSDLKLQLERDVFLGATTEISAVDPSEVQLMDVSPQQIVSVATALIPFLEHDDANRALMGSNMQRQAVPLLKPEIPVVGTGMELAVARNSNMPIFAEKAGVVKFVDANTGWVAGDSGTILKTTNGGTSWTAETSGVAVTLRGMSFLDANTGYSYAGYVTTNTGTVYSEFGTFTRPVRSALRHFGEDFDRPAPAAPWLRTTTGGPCPPR